MLSKLEFFEANGTIPESPVGLDALQDELQRHFDPPGPTVTPALGGTLGVCFHLDFAGARRFLKTHLPGEQARANLAKEGDLLVQLYGREVVLERLELLAEGGSRRLGLLMTELSHVPVLIAAEDAAAMVCSYSERLEGYRPGGLRVEWGFEQYLTHGHRAIAALLDRSLIRKPIGAELMGHLDLLHRELGALPRAVCHGDLGPKNIMTDGSQLVAIDWEDAFWGVAGYDYLYWLTFMDNRRFLHSSAFGRTGLDSRVERAILALVVLLKSFLSVKSGTFIRNTVPIQTRIAEVLALPNAT